MWIFCPIAFDTALSELSIRDSLMDSNKTQFNKRPSVNVQYMTHWQRSVWRPAEVFKLRERHSRNRWSSKQYFRSAPMLPCQTLIYRQQSSGGLLWWVSVCVLIYSSKHPKLIYSFRFLFKQFKWPKTDLWILTVLIGARRLVLREENIPVATSICSP